MLLSHLRTLTHWAVRVLWKMSEEVWDRDGNLFEVGPWRGQEFKVLDVERVVAHCLRLRSWSFGGLGGRAIG